MADSPKFIEPRYDDGVSRRAEFRVPASLLVAGCLLWLTFIVAAVFGIVFIWRML